MTPDLPRICQSVFLLVFLVPTSLCAQGMMQGTSAPSPRTDTSIPYGTGNIHSFNYPKFYQQGMSGMIRRLPVREIQDMPGIPYVTNPYGGMFGSMGNVYSPYYRQFHPSGMSGPLTGMTGISGMHYIVNPYAGMYGSMGNVYSPYYRQFHHSGMGGTAGAPGPGTIPGQGIRYHYPYFLPPAMGTM